MLFNSFEYLLFLPLAFILYWFVFHRIVRIQNLLLVILSYIFYGWWDWRFLSLIFVSTLVDYMVGIQLSAANNKNKKAWLALSILVNLGLLGFFKYYNFFVDSFSKFAGELGFAMQDTWMLNIILPVGISFYTFQTMSYSLDIYHNKINPTKDFIAFAAYVSFFPQLVAGPIERASSLLPQILKKRKFDYTQGVQGLRLMLWGFFKKMAIADALAPIVDDIFTNYHSYSSGTLFMGAVFFGFQIYCDFSGYSDIAIGTAKLFGVELRSNFKFPYFSRNIAEFWRRWHISLSTWFRDYLYIPLGGSYGSRAKALRNIFIIFIVSGFWHGANWTFILWGALHALLFIPLFLTHSNRSNLDTIIGQYQLFPSIKELVQVLFTFLLVTLSWIFFRAENVGIAFEYISQIFQFTDGVQPFYHPRGFRMEDYFILLGAFYAYEYIIRKNERNPFSFRSAPLRYVVYCILVLLIFLFFDDQVDRSFIYFQF
nr:MBOAT family O-acyltransferase [Allomuricauda sp.]